jgi:hypothetical protein
MERQITSLYQFQSSNYMAAAGWAGYCHEATRSAAKGLIKK